MAKMANGSKYEGDWLLGRYEGYGVMSHIEGEYELEEGTWMDGKREGFFH